MGARRLQPAGDLLAPAVAETIGKLTLAPEDAAAVKLAERYAATIDNAATLAAELAEVPYDDDTVRRVYALAKRVEAQTVMAELGPRLLAVLDALGATPAARARIKGGGEPSRAQSRLAALRSARG